MNGVVEKINNEKNKLVVDLWKTTQNYEVKLCHSLMLEYLRRRRNAKLHFKIIRRINCASRREKKRYVNSTNKILMNS